MQRPLWYKQAGFRFLDGDRTIYIDPWEIPAGEPAADFILLTHAHHDHFDPETIMRLSTPKTLIFAPKDVAAKLDGNIVAVAPNETHNSYGIHIKTVPAYNIGKPYHPKENAWVGFILEIAGSRFYHAGDTDHIPEMANIRSDIALLPIGGTYTMNVQEAAAAASVLRPQAAIPMHYGFVIGSEKDGERFRKLAQVPVEILAPQSPFIC